LVVQVNGMLLEGKKVFVGPFLKRTDRPADKEAHYTNIYVKNLAESVTEEQLEKMFGEYGKVRCAAPPASPRHLQTLCKPLLQIPRCSSLPPCVCIRCDIMLDVTASHH
jgi:RNA recognition motif-containing protein